MIRRNFLKGLAALFGGFVPRKRLHTDLEYGDINSPYRGDYIPYLNGKPAYLVQAANAKEGWIDVLVMDESKNFHCFLRSRGKNIIRRIHGQVQILLATPERREEFDRNNPMEIIHA